MAAKKKESPKPTIDLRPLVEREKGLQADLLKIVGIKSDGKEEGSLGQTVDARKKGGHPADVHNGQ